MTKQIIITINEKDQVSFSTKGKLNYSMVTEMMGTTQLAIFNQLAKTAEKDLPPKQFELLKEELWDQYNGTASNILDEMIPAHMRKDLTEEAIQAKENEILLMHQG